MIMYMPTFGFNSFSAYLVGFAFFLVLTLRALFKRDAERASAYALCMIWLMYATKVAMFWR